MAVTKARPRSATRKCEYCKSVFKPVTGRQIYCKKESCRKERNYLYWKDYIEGWKKSHPGYWQNYLRKWRSDHPDYFVKWRRKNPDYYRKWYQRRKAELAKARGR